LESRLILQERRKRRRIRIIIIKIIIRNKAKTLSLPNDLINAACGRSQQVSLKYQIDICF
jgi:hypothetical protein